MEHGMRQRMGPGLGLPLPLMIIGILLYAHICAAAPHGGAAERRTGAAGQGDRTAAGQRIAVAAGKRPVRAQTELVKEGKLLVVRGIHEAEVQLTDQQGKRWLLVGPLREELLRIEGHVVRVWAVAGKKKLMQPTLHPRRYEILDSGGRRPVVGLLRQFPQQELRLERSDPPPLKVRGKKPLLARMRRVLDCKIWVVGDVAADTLTAHKFGSLSCKKPKPIKPKGARKETER